MDDVVRECRIDDVITRYDVCSIGGGNARKAYPHMTYIGYGSIYSINGVRMSEHNQYHFYKNKIEMDERNGIPDWVWESCKGHEQNKFLKQTDMETIKIKAPEGFEFDKVENGEIVFKEKKKIVTYEDVSRAMFLDNECVLLTIGGIIVPKMYGISAFSEPTNATTSRQLFKLLAMNKLMNVAKWLNPKGENATYSISIGRDENFVVYDSTNYGQPSFTSRKSAQRAIDILGADVIHTVLTNEY